MVKKGRRILLFSLLFLPSFFLSTQGSALYQGEPYALGIGEAYTTLAHGPLAPLWNAAGVLESSGLHGAVALCRLPGGGRVFFSGGAVCAEEGPAVAWTMARHEGDEGEILGTFAFPFLAHTAVGGSLSYYFGASETAVSFNVGVNWRGERMSLAASVFDLGAVISEEKWPSRFLFGVSLPALEGVTVAIDLHLDSAGGEVALGGEARAWQMNLRWGTVLSLGGGLSQLGLGIGFTLLGFPIDLSVGFVGSDLEMWSSIGARASLPAWW
jgi:hypothetical protein